MKAAARITASADGTPIGFHTLGAGNGLILLGGSMRTAEDYLPLASVLARRFEVHVIDRRGRGASGPQGPDYAIEKECEDLRAIHAQTGATRVFGHSYGGLIALEAAKRMPAVTELAVYEPGLVLDGSLPTAWTRRYRQLLADDETRRAFAHFVQGSGHAPSAVERLPLWYLTAVMRLVVRERQWRRMEPLLEANLVEHEEVLKLADTLPTYAAITARVLLLGGADSPAFATRPLYELDRVLAHSTLAILDGLNHNAPDEKAPAAVGERLLGLLW